MPLLFGAFDIGIMSNMSDDNSPKAFWLSFILFGSSHTHPVVTRTPVLQW